MTYFLSTSNILAISSGQFNIYISLNYIKLIKAVEKLCYSYLCIKFDRRKNEQRFCDTSNVLSWLMYDTSMEKYRKMSLNLFESLGGRLRK